LPGVFSDNPGGPAVNGSLWTLFYEVLCYSMIVVVGYSGLLGTRTFIVFLLTFAAWQVFARTGQWDAHGNQFALLSLPFVFGMAAYVYRDRLPLGGWLAATLWTLAIFLRQTPAWHLMFPLSIAYGSLWLGMVRPLRVYHRLGDYSYGVYIYAFPVQQAVAAIASPMSPWTMMAVAFPITLVLAILSWHFAEAPALARRHSIVPPLLRKDQRAL
jgi:peptidoglycan/LPS O-acetylase OafA/YrhL